MEKLLEYTSLITLCGVAISFMIGLIKWIDQRNREQEQRHYEALHKMVLIASGVDESGKTVKMVQQIAAIYQLQEFKNSLSPPSPYWSCCNLSTESNPTLELNTWPKH